MAGADEEKALKYSTTKRSSALTPNPLPGGEGVQLPQSMLATFTRHRTPLLWLIYTSLALTIYYPSLWGGFVYDDTPAVQDNQSIRSLWPIWDTLWAEKENPLAGRPIPNLSMALHYAAHGLDTFGYHLVNVLIHIVCAMLLHAIVRRTLIHHHPSTGRPWLNQYQGSLASTDQPSHETPATLLSSLIALLWLVHPVNSETVAYITQRTELCVTLFLFLTLYCVIRAAQSAHAARWQTLAVVCCALGMLSKEVMVGAPLLVLFFERCFLRSSWKQTLGQSWPMYVGLAATWLILAAIVSTGPRSFSVGFNRGVTVWDYMKAQALSLAWYLWLCIWPQGLRLTYWWGVAPPWYQAAPAGILILLLLSLSVFGLVRGLPYGFLGIWCFVLLGPSSSFVPIVTEITADRRVYQPSAAIIALLILGGYKVLHTWRPALPFWVRTQFALVLMIGITVALSIVTWQRATLFGDPIQLWYDNIRLEPTNPFAHNNLGSTLAQQKQHAASAWHFMETLHHRPMHTAYSGLAVGLMTAGLLDQAEIALQYSLRIKPNYATAWNRWGMIHLERKQPEQALEKILKAVEYEPYHAAYLTNLGLAYFQLERYHEAIDPLTKVLRDAPDKPQLHAMLGMSYRQLKQLHEAKIHLQRTVELDPTDELALVELGLTLAALGDVRGAVQSYEKALAIKDDDIEARYNLAAGLLLLRQATRAAEQFRECLKRDDKHLLSHIGLAKALGELGDAPGAEQSLRNALVLQPDHHEALRLLGDLLAATGRLHEAVQTYQQLVKAHPDSAEGYNSLGVTLAQLNRLPEAVAQFEQAARLEPSNKDYAANYQRAKSMVKP